MLGVGWMPATQTELWPLPSTSSVQDAKILNNQLQSQPSWLISCLIARLPGWRILQYDCDMSTRFMVCAANDLPKKDPANSAVPSNQPEAIFLH